MRGKEVEVEKSGREEKKRNERKRVKKIISFLPRARQDHNRQKTRDAKRCLQEVCLTVRLPYSYDQLGVEGLSQSLCVHQLHSAVLETTLDVGEDGLVPRVQHKLEKA